MKIGFIGLGNMGAPMAMNLAKAGHDVKGFDLSPFDVEGVTGVSTVHEAVEIADAVITMLPSGAILRAVVGEILPFMKAGAVFLDSSTVEVDAAREVAKQATEQGMLPLDAPVSGGVGGAAAGMLTFMVGGSKEAYAMALPLFEIMGQKSVHCGSAGAGQAAKICNNMILGINMIGTCEAFAMGKKLGLEPQRLFDVVSTSSGFSWVSNNYCPFPGVGPQSPADHDYQPGFSAELMLKDLRLAQAAADMADAHTPLGKMAETIYAGMVEDDDEGGRDFSAMLPRLESKGRGK